MTFLSIAETVQGDLTGYIPSNLVSMSDGQLYMSSAVFAEGIRPAVDLGLSLSIIGGRAQPPLLKTLSRDLRADYARYTDVVKLSRISSGISEEAERTIRKGEVILSILQQPQHKPVSLAEEVLLLYALQRGFLTELEKDRRDRFTREIHGFALGRDPGLVAALEKGPELTPEIERGLGGAMKAYFEETAREPENSEAAGGAGS
jgi:F-type H+-transporting ATPase subunit alpha